MRYANLKFIITVSVLIMMLTTVAGVEGVTRRNDSFPMPGVLYTAGGPTQYSGDFQAEIVSMSLQVSNDEGQTISPSELGGGQWHVDSFFDVFVELSVDGGEKFAGKLNGPVQLKITVDPDTSGTAGTFDTEIVSMSLAGMAGQTPIQIRSRDAASGLPTGKRQITDLGGGLYHIDSFFDVFTELSVDGGASWAVAEEPTRIEAAAQIGEFNVTVEGSARQWNMLNPQLSGGDGWVMPGTEDRWFAYPQDPEEPEVDDQGNVEDWPTWWNEWWYDDPYDPDRIKKIGISFDYAPTEPGMPGYAIITVNWSTTDWSINPPDGIDPSQQPPLMDFDPANPSVAWVGRVDITKINFDNGPGHFSLKDFKLPIPYNPEWVSVDVRGYNFSIKNGKLIHQCMKDPDLPPKIEQLDWNGLNTSTPDSQWGRITLDYNRPAGIYYFNLSINHGGIIADQWVVQNLSIKAPGGTEKLMTYFDLGVPAGMDVTALNYGYTITNTPIAAGPPAASNTAVADLDFQIGTEDGIDLGSPPAPNSGAKEDVNGGTVSPLLSGVIPDKDKFVNQPQGRNQCAPGAISNSLKYLQARGGVSGSLPTSISDVGSVVGTTSTGTPSTWYLKKKTHYRKHVTTRWIDAPLTLDKIKELIKELKDGQDIEMDLEGHVEVLAGIRVKPDGTVDLDLYDDNQKDDKSDPMHTSPLMTDGRNDYVDGMKLERFVIECPKETTSVGITDFSLNTFDEWLITLSGENPNGSILPMMPHEWEGYMNLWNKPDLLENPDLPYPPNVFMPPDLWVYEGDKNPDEPDPDDGGLVMVWGDPQIPENQASAWKYKYEPDPDLSNSIITVSVTAPVGINQISLGLETPPSASGNIRSWYWNCGPSGSGAPIVSGVPTTITIDTSVTGTTAATPTATNYLNTPGFSITNVGWIICDENGSWVGGQTPAPGPGGAPVFLWNYWHWLMVSPKTSLSKALLTKHSQGPVLIDAEVNPNPDVPLFWGWDEVSDYHIGPIAADDWQCKDKRPVTDFHWWGSFPGWREPYPPCHPKAFHIGIWTDVPSVPGDPTSYSHPGKLVWEHVCENYAWNFAGFDRDPRGFDPHNPAGGIGPDGNPIPADDPSYEPADACFQYNQLLDGDDWFYQKPMEDGKPRTYWISIAPIWGEECKYKWGWKTRPKYYMDNAVSITAVKTVNADGTTSMTWPPTLGSIWSTGTPLQIPAFDPANPNSHADSVSWDLAFEISTNEKAYEDDPIPGDIGGPGLVLVPDGKVNINDLAIMALHWLEEKP